MKELEEIFIKNKNTKSDINEHLGILYYFSKECSHITEFGVRTGVSTLVFLYSNCNKIISYDIKKLPEVDQIIQLAKENNINFSFIEKDVLEVSIEPTELLFIDTIHRYEQLLKELNLHSSKVSKYIILHDTTTFRFTDENLYEHASKNINELSSKQGLIAAIEDFLNNTQGLSWEIFSRYENNNGLTILKNKNYKNE